jgi:hypothetical protein
MQHFFEEKYLEGIFNTSIDMSQINDDRFSGFLNKLFEASPRKIFFKISCQAFMPYGLTVKNVNFDTTSKVTWGKYQTPKEKVGLYPLILVIANKKRR